VVGMQVQMQEFVATVERVIDCIQVRAGMCGGRVEGRVRWGGCIGGNGEVVSAGTIEGR
jgi:hypothetical protein